MITVGELIDFLEQWAPFSSAEEWDNVGLLVGKREMRVTGVVTTLDVTPEVIAQAQIRGANVVVSHHPVIFSPLNRLDPESIPARLIAAGMAAVCVHTNLDRALDGVNDCLAGRLRLTEVREAEKGWCRIGYLAKPMEPEAFARYVAGCLGVPVRMAPGAEKVSCVGLCSGAGGDFLPGLAKNEGAQGLVTGEIKHHEWLELARCGATVVEAGHFDTEKGIASVLAQRFSEAFPELPVAEAEQQRPYWEIFGDAWAGSFPDEK